MNSITITFASRSDFAQALKQITKARDYRARGKQLGTLGQGLLLSTIERAERVTTGHDSELFLTLRAIRRDCDAAFHGETDIGYMDLVRAISNAITDALDTTKTT